MRSRGFILFLLVLFITLNGCQLQHNQDLYDVICAKAKQGDTVDLRELSSFHWDALIVVEPYTQIENLALKTNTDLSNIKYNRIESVDSYNLLVFLDKGRSVEICQSILFFSPTNRILKRDELLFLKSNDNIFRQMRE